MIDTGERRQYRIIFLMQEKNKHVFVDISFAEDLQKVLHKHWQGKQTDTARYFSMENVDAVPQMYVWELGYMSRGKALVFFGKMEKCI